MRMPRVNSRVNKRKSAAALVSMIVILVAVAAFAGAFLNVHDTRVALEEAGVQRLRAEAAAMAATHITLRQLKTNSVLQADMARVVYEKDTAFDAPPLYEIAGDLTGTVFQIAVWPGLDSVRLRARGISDGVYYERWTQMPMRLRTTDNLLLGGDFEDPAAIGAQGRWDGAASVEKWIAGYGFSLVDDPRLDATGVNAWNVTLQGGNHVAEATYWSNAFCQYVAGTGDDRLDFSFDYLKSQGTLRVKIYGADELPAAGWVSPGNSTYTALMSSGTLLYDSGSLATAADWTPVAAVVSGAKNYEYIKVVVGAVGGGATPATLERGVDNVVLKPH
jgi:hypothetical protein